MGYIVLGMHRSGTSLTSAILHHLGVDMLHGTPVVKNRESPIGYYENSDLMKLNDQILRIAGGSWKAPPSLEDILIAGDKLKDKISTQVKKFNKYNKWGIKDPRLCLTYPVYQEFIPEPRFIVLLRDTESNYEAFKRVRFPFLHQRYRNKQCFYNLYERYISSILNIIEDYPSLIIKFESYFISEDDLDIILADLKSFTDSTVAIEDVKGLVNRKYKHH